MGEEPAAPEFAHRETVLRKFAEIAAAYNEGQATRLADRTWVHLAAPRPTDVVLDVASGTGAILTIFASRVRFAVGVDISAAMLSTGRCPPGPDRAGAPLLLVADATRLPFIDESFELVTCSRALHHMEGASSAAAEMGRVLRRGGRLAVLDNVTYDEPRLAAEHNKLETLRDPSHARTLTARELTDSLTAPGLAVHTLLIEEVRRSVGAWLDDAGTDDDARKEILAFLRDGLRRGDDFCARHFAPSSDGFTFRYRVAWVLAVRR